MIPSSPPFSRSSSPGPSCSYSYSSAAHTEASTNPAAPSLVPLPRVANRRCTALKIRNVSSRSSPLPSPGRRPGSNHSRHSLCSPSALAFAGAPSTRRSRSSSAPARVSASGHRAVNRSNRPNAAACSIPGTPRLLAADDARDEPPGPPRTTPSEPLAASPSEPPPPTPPPPAFPPNSRRSTAPRAALPRLRAPRQRGAAEVTSAANGRLARSRAAPPPSSSSVMATGCPPRASSNTAARISRVSGYRVSDDPTARKSPARAESEAPGPR